MSIFYIKTKDGEVFELTATTDVGFSHRNSNTKFPVESGASVTDHVVIENSTFSLSGVITQVVQLNKDTPQKGIKDYIEGIDKLRKSKEVFTVYLDNRLKPFTNCLFTEFSGTKGITEGVGSWRISLQIEQIKRVDRAKASTVQLDTSSETEAANAKDKETKDALSAKKDAGNKSGRETTFIEGGLRRLLGDAVKAANLPYDGVTKAG